MHHPGPHGHGLHCVQNAIASVPPFYAELRGVEHHTRARPCLANVDRKRTLGSVGHQTCEQPDREISCTRAGNVRNGTNIHIHNTGKALQQDLELESGQMVLMALICYMKRGPGWYPTMQRTGDCLVLVLMISLGHLNSLPRGLLSV